MVIAIMQTTSDRLRTVFKFMTDFRQTSDRLQMSDSYFRLWTRTFENQDLDFGLQTLNFTLLMTSDRLRTSDIRIRTSHFELDLEFRF